MSFFPFSFSLPPFLLFFQRWTKLARTAILDPMIRRALVTVALLAAVLTLFAYAMYAWNVAPAVPRVSVEEAARTGKPFVIKLHAQWCAVCLVTKDVWGKIEETYAQRVNLVVLDFTNEANTTASRAEADRLGLQKFFEEFSGVTGTIVVLDGRTKEVAASINGSRDFAEYRAAIDTVLNDAAKRAQ